MDGSLTIRRDQILSEMAARETPRVAVLFAVLLACFDIAYALTGTTEPRAYYVADAVQGLTFLAAAYVIWSGRLPARYAPSAFATAMVVSNAALNFQYSLDPASNTLGVMAITMVASGALILLWVPFAVAAVAMAAVTTYTLLTHGTLYAGEWILTMLLALVVSAILLHSRVRSALSMAIASSTIEDIATRDPLTGLLNRRGLTLMSSPVAAIAYRQREPMFAAFIDIVGLKRVNDTHGHATGDLVIVRTAHAVRSAARSADLVTRWGGDEFLVVGIGPQPDEEEFLDRIRAHLDLDGLEGRWPGGLSIGTSTDHGGDVESLIAAADAAMYITRSAGRATERY